MGASPEENDQKRAGLEGDDGGPEPVTVDHSPNRREPQAALCPLRLAQLAGLLRAKFVEAAHGGGTKRKR